MPDAREVRRICGFLISRSDRLHLGQLPDARDRRGRRWSLPPLVLASLLGMMTGQNSFADVERLTDKLPRAIRKRLGIPRRVPDTTLRDAHATLDPSDLRPVLHSQVRSAHASKSLRSDFNLPFGVVAMDGKYITVPAVDDKYSQRCHRDLDQGPLTGRIGTMTAVLTSSEARPCIDVYPIAAATNEMGTFSRALDSLLRAYGQLDLFRLVSYDAGACSMANAQVVRDRHLHYLFRLKGSQPELSTAASLWLGSLPKQQADAVSVDGSGNRQVTRRVFVRACTATPEGWEHLKTVIRVDSESFDRLGRPVEESFYFLSSLPIDRLSPEQWLTIIRRHWGVETAHQVLDVAFREDDRPWVTENPRLTVVLMILRRIGYTLLTLFRSVTQRSDSRRTEPWKVLFERIRDALLLATDELIDGLRRRTDRDTSPPPLTAASMSTLG